jgi:hypothetical protein
MLAPLLAALALAAAPADDRPLRTGPAGEPRSLLSAETLGDGGSALLFTAGFPFLGAAWAQGVKDGLDAGAAVEVDWTTAEIFGGGTLRRVFHRAGPWTAAWRGRLGLYRDAGADWIVEDNRSNTGVQVAPGVVASRTAPRGTWSFSADLPLTLTLTRTGVVAAPRVAVAFETPLFGDLSAGARVGGFWHVAGGDAPLAGDSRGVAELSGVLTWRLF